MAGIGFRIHKLLQSPDVFSQARGAVAALVVSSGPWICAMAMIGAIAAMLRAIAAGGGSGIDAIQFQILINYSFAAALVFFSTFELIVTRQVADLLYLKRFSAVAELFERVATFYLIGVALVSGVLFACVQISWKTAILCHLLMGGVCLTWAGMTFLSAAKNHGAIVRGFFLGALFGVLTAAVIGYGLNGKLNGFLFGIVAGIFSAGILLGRRVIAEFRNAGGVVDTLDSQEILRFFRKHGVLIVLGFVLGLGAWIDKIIFWFTDASSVEVVPTLRYSPLYDSGIFLGYLFVIPVLGYFLVQTETTFYRAFRGYFWSLEEKAPLALLEVQRQNLVRATGRAISGLVLFQAMMTVLGLSVSAPLIQFFHLPPESIVPFRYALVGAGLHVLALAFNTMILYFDLPRIALRNYLVFLIANGTGALITAQLDSRVYGLGYAIAAFLCFGMSLLSLEGVLRGLHFHVFQRQPLGVSEETHAAEQSLRNL